MIRQVRAIVDGFVDDGQSATVLCPDACEQVNESEGASVAILLGCKTVVQEVY